MVRPVRILCLEPEDHSGSGAFGEIARARDALVQSWCVDRWGAPADTSTMSHCAWGVQFHAESVRDDLEPWIHPDPYAAPVGFHPRRSLATRDEHIVACSDAGRSTVEASLDCLEARHEPAVRNPVRLVHTPALQMKNAAGARPTDEARI